MLVRTKDVIKQTDKAFYVEAETTEGFVATWVPKSRVTFPDDNHLIIDTWLGKKKNFIDAETTAEAPTTVAIARGDEKADSEKTFKELMAETLSKEKIKKVKEVKTVETSTAKVKIHRDGNEEEAALAYDEIFAGEMANLMGAVQRMSNLTGMSEIEVLAKAIKEVA